MSQEKSNRAAATTVQGAVQRVTGEGLLTITTEGRTEPVRIELAEGLRVKHYEVIRLLGAGGMGQVFLSRDLKLGRLVALKFVPQALAGNAQSFLREARATAQLNHENIVTLHEVDEHESVPYMVLEHIKGESLAAWHKRHKERAGKGLGEGVSGYRAVELLRPVVEALICAHEAGIVHRDLKPHNIMLGDNGSTKVLDFGLAQALDHPSVPSVDTPNAVVPGQPKPKAGAGRGQAAVVDDEEEPSPEKNPGEPVKISGTLPYMSPEQLRGEAIDERSDLWAIGIMLFELLTGQHPLAPATRRIIAQVANLSEAMPSISSARPELGRLGTVVDSCLSKRRDSRPRNARELLSELETSVAATQQTRPADSNPFVGLAAFREADADRYFGREQEVQQGVRRLREQVMLTVAGPSGAGKSSFVRAGIIASLKRSGEPCDAYVVRPGAGAILALAELLDYSAPGSPACSQSASSSEPLWPESGSGKALAPDADLQALCQRLRDEAGHLAQKLRERAVARHARAVLFVDQFEELYTLTSAPDRQSFLRAIEAVADDVASPLRLVLAIRADYLDRVEVGEDGFGREVIDSIFWLNEMGPERLRLALKGPLGGTGVEFEHDSIVASIVAELSDTRGALPLLQFTAARLWEERDRNQGVLLASSLAQLGGVAGTLARHADEVLESMSGPQVEVARAVLVRLVTPERTRAVVPIAELQEMCSRRETTLAQTITKLVDSRLVVPEGKRHGSQGVRLELVHESLITRWSHLAAWLDEDEVDARFLARLRTAAAEWEKAARSKGLLWTGEAAAEAQLWKREARGEKATRLTKLESDYLEAVVHQAARTSRRRRQLMTATVGLLLAVAVGMTYSNKRIQQEATRAEQQAAQARNMARMAASEKWRANPTMRLAFLRDMEGEDPPPGWQRNIRETLGQPIPFLVLEGHTAQVYFVRYSPDGQHIVSGSLDQTVRVWRRRASSSRARLHRGHRRRRRR